MSTDHLFLAKTLDQVLVNKKKNYGLVDFAVSADQKVKIKENEKFNKYLNLARELKYQWNLKVSLTPIVTGIGNQRKNRDHPDHLTGKIDENTEKSPGDLRRLDVTQTLVKDRQQMLMWKTR